MTIECILMLKPYMIVFSIVYTNETIEEAFRRDSNHINHTIHQVIACRTINGIGVWQRLPQIRD